MMPQPLLEDYAKALLELEQVLAEPSESRLIQAGCIQYFEFCFELAWKSVKSVAEQEGLECHSPKSCLKIAHQNGGLKMNHFGWRCSPPATACRTPAIQVPRSVSIPT